MSEMLAARCSCGCVTYPSGKRTLCDGHRPSMAEPCDMQCGATQAPSVDPGANAPASRPVLLCPPASPDPADPRYPRLYEEHPGVVGESPGPGDTRVWKCGCRVSSDIKRRICCDACQAQLGRRLLAWPPSCVATGLDAHATSDDVCYAHLPGLKLEDSPCVWAWREGRPTAMKSVQLRAEAAYAATGGETEKPRAELVNHPAHYGGDTTYESIKVIEAWGLGFNLGNTVKYVSRAGKKGNLIEDLKKARWYLDREITRLEQKP